MKGMGSGLRERLWIKVVISLARSLWCVTVIASASGAISPNHAGGSTPLRGSQRHIKGHGERQRSHLPQPCGELPHPYSFLRDVVGLVNEHLTTKYLPW